MWNIFEALITLFEQLLVFRFICGVLKYDISCPKGRIVYICGSVVGTVFAIALSLFSRSTYWIGIAYIMYWFIYSLIGVYWFIFSLICFKGAVLKKLFASMVADVVLLGTKALVTSIACALIDIDVSYVYTKPGLVRFLVLVTIQVINVYLFSLILKFVDGSLLRMKKSEWALVISVFLVSFMVLALIHTIFSAINLNAVNTVLVFASESGIVLLNVICLYMTLSLSKSNNAAEKIKLLEQQQEHNIQYAESIRKQYEEMRSIRHDMKQHLAVISRLANEGDISGAAEYAAECSNLLEAVDIFVDVKNNFINAILNSKLSIAKSKGITVLCSSSSDISGICEHDLCILLGNMLDNAIEAAEKIQGAKFIEVSILVDEDKLNICVSNSIASSVLKNNPKLKTSKSNKALHGFGIRSIWHIAEKYNGSLDFYEEELVFNCRVLLFKKEL